MANLAETVLFGHDFGPFFNGAALNFNGIAAVLAYQMMMMGFTA